jgi:hypothetical protein
METVCTVATVAAVVGAIAGTAAGVGTGLAIAAGCAGTGPFAIFCLLLALIIAAIVSALISAAVTGFGWLICVAAGGDKGSPAEVGAEPGSGTVEVGDHVAILGDWIFDNAHDGWHELLHPVKSLIRLPCPTGTKVPGVDVEEPSSQRSKDAIEKNCLTLIAANAGETCRLLSQPRDANVKQDQANNDPSFTHPRRLTYAAVNSTGNATGERNATPLTPTACPGIHADRLQMSGARRSFASGRTDPGSDSALDPGWRPRR